MACWVAYQTVITEEGSVLKYEGGEVHDGRRAGSDGECAKKLAAASEVWKAQG